MSKIEIFGFAPSTYVQTVRLLCRELDLDYTLLPLEFRQESHRVLHPFLKMPALRHGDITLFETLAIAMYLCGQVTEPQLVPAKLLNRCDMFAWISVGMDYYYAHLVGPSMGDQSQPVELEHWLCPLQRKLSATPYVAGPEISVADLVLLPMLLFVGNSLGESAFQPFPAVASWLQALQNRQGYAEVLQHDAQ